MNALEWTATLAVRVDRWCVGVRANSEEAAATVDALFAPARVPPLDGVVAPNFSVRVASAEPARTGRRDLHLVYRDHEIVARRRDTTRLLDDLVALVEATAHLAETEMLAVAGAAVVVDGAHVVLLPEQQHRTLLMHAERLERLELRLLPTRSHRIDPTTGELVIRRSGVAGDETIPLRVWFVRTPTGQESRLRRAQGVQAAYPTIVNQAALGPQATLRMLATASESVLFHVAPAMSSGDVVATVQRLFG
ncbi:MAG: hypothetical protein GEU96_00435 [Propionibacteriales bacterium]|nr:hypothetical protein [Propionibacteriales bacterium]